MVGTPRRSPRAAPRLLLWTLAAAFGVVLFALGTGAANAAPTAADSGTDAPVGDLVSDLTDGVTTPLTDALAPVTQPVERAAAPVTQPVVDTARGVLGGADRTPDAAGDDSASHDGAADSTSGTRGGSSAPTDVSSPEAPAPPSGTADRTAGEPTSGSRSAAASTDRDTRDDDRVVADVDSVEVGDLDFGPRSFPDDHNHGTATAPTTASVVGLDDAVAPRVGRDDLLTAVLAPRDSNHGTQNFTRPDVSPG